MQIWQQRSGQSSAFVDLPQKITDAGTRSHTQSGGEALTRTIAYDDFDNIRSRTFGRGGRTVGQVQVRDASSTSVYWQANSTDARGHVVDEQLGNGVQTVRGYDAVSGLPDYVQSGLGGAIQNDDVT